MPCVRHTRLRVSIFTRPPRGHVPPQCSVRATPTHAEFPVAFAVFVCTEGQHLSDGFLNLWRDQIVARFVGVKFLTLC